MGNTTNVQHQIIGNAGCVCKNFKDNWKWRAATGSTSSLAQSAGLSTFSPQRFCQLLGNRTILFFGDSTAHQSSSTIMNAVMPGGCAPQIRVTTAYTMLSLRFKTEVHWYEALKKHQPDYYVWSVGPHVHSEGLFIDIFEKVLSNMTSPETRKAFPNTQFVYRTNQPGGCHFNRTLLSPTHVDHAARTFDYASMKLEAHNWPWFYWRDLYSLARCQQEGMRTIDLRMLYSRVDSHLGHDMPGGDCLHFCQPGPLDVMVDLVYDMLVEDNAADISPK